jgi:Na+-driven multidrug efflux pump
VTLVASILPLVGLFQFFDGTAAVTGGILRARGKQVVHNPFACLFVLILCIYQVIGALLNLRYTLSDHINK